MKSKSLILMFVSLFFGLIAAVGISQVMGRNSGSGLQKQVKLVPVVLATEFLDHDTELTEKNCKVENWPAEIVPDNSAQSLEEVKHKAVTTRINKGVPISLNDVVDVSQISTLMIPPGFRVQGVKVSEEDVVNGLIQPGDHVDLIGFFENTNNKGERNMRITTFMKNVKVFSIDGNTRRDPGPRKSNGGSGEQVLGLLVTLKQAEQIVLVQRVATLRVVLRDSTGTNSPEQGLSPDGEVDFDAITFFEEAKNYIKKMAEKPTRAASNEPEPAKPAFVAMYQLGDSVVYFPFDEAGNLIPPERTADPETPASNSPELPNVAPVDDSASPSGEEDEDSDPGG
ncbi:MAG: Flp pilus assembly protein CpaB [Planctomycetota bacterium]